MRFGGNAMDEEKNACCCSGRTTERSEAERRQLLNRLSRIEGQVRGLRSMVEKIAYCPDIMVQVTAVNAALNAFNRELMTAHIRTCVAEGVRSGDGEKLDELAGLLQKLMK